MEFKLYEYVELKNEEDFYSFWDFVETNTGAEIDVFYVNAEDEVVIANNFIVLEQLWIRPSEVSKQNINNILNLLNYLEKYSNVEIEIADINVR